MTIRDAARRLLFSLYHVYDAAEAANIADLVMEHVTGWRRADRLLNDNVTAGNVMLARLEEFGRRLIAHEPVQYVLGEAWFCDMKFIVDPTVLIPRPETEELVEWIYTDWTGAAPRILDIGTGSGCIAVALKKKLPAATVFACDISRAALRIAGKNAAELAAEITFFELDILSSNAPAELPAVDIIVSNPPYIPESGKAQMAQNVVAHEPHVALFVEDEDPIKFYRRIAGCAAGTYYFEVHEDLAHEVSALFVNATIRRDMQGKNRMVKAGKVIERPTYLP